MAFAGIVIVIFFVALVAALAFLFKRETSDVARALKLHQRYTVKAARASRRGQEGVAAVYSEAANNVWEATQNGSLRRRFV